MILVLAKVPLAMTSSLPKINNIYKLILFEGEPLLDPYELKLSTVTPLLIKYLAAGEFLEIFPAGEMWSVVIESPKLAKTKASLTSLIYGKLNSIV